MALEVAKGTQASPWPIPTPACHSLYKAASATRGGTQSGQVTAGQGCWHMAQVQVSEARGRGGAWGCRGLGPSSKVKAGLSAATGGHPTHAGQAL